MKILYSLIISLMILAGLSNALTARIGNSIILVPVERLNEVIEKSISIENTNSVAVDATLRASDEIKDIIEIVDNNFVIQSKETKNTRFNIKLTKPGEYVGTIWIKLSASGEVPIELPVRVVISAKSKGEVETKNEDEIRNETSPKINSNFQNLYKSLGGNALLLIMSLSTTFLSCILLFLLYKIKKKETKKKREQGTLRKVDKDGLKGR